MGFPASISSTPSVSLNLVIRNYALHSLALAASKIELIEPQGSTSTLFSDVLPVGGSELAIIFHHVAIRIDGSVENWQQHRASIDFARHPIVYQGALADMLCYFYTDERKTLGHYLEHVWMSPELLVQMAGAIPTYPPRP